MRPSAAALALVGLASVLGSAPSRAPGWIGSPTLSAASAESGPASPSGSASNGSAPVQKAPDSAAMPAPAAYPMRGASLETIRTPPRTVYSPYVPAGITHVIRTTRTIRDGARTIVSTTVTRVRRAYQPLPPSVLRIPALHFRARLVEGVSQRAMARGPGHFPGMALPGEMGNCGIAAHSNVPGCAYFRSLRRLRPGDSIYVDTPTGTYDYIVSEMHTVRPNQTFDLRPTTYRRLTLVTCTLPDARRRLIVIAVTPTNDGAAFSSPAAAPAMPMAGRAVIRRHVTRRHRTHR